MAELIEGKVRAQLTVQTSQHIQVEGCRDAQRVIVGTVEHQRVLLQVDPDEQAAVRSANFSDPDEKTPGVFWNEVADGRARVVRHSPSSASDHPG